MGIAHEPYDRPGEPSGDLSSQARGRWGEREAARWYVRRGYQILETNWRCSSGELDLVARRGATVVFCEVKARATDAYGGGAAAVGWAKQRRIRRLAAEWLRTAAVHGVDVRFDVVALTGTRIDVIEAAF